MVACNSAGCSAIDSATPAALSGTPPGTPANQRYEYDGSTIVVSWDASADADTYTVYYDDFFGSSCRLGSRGPSFCEELATDLTAASYTHASPDRDDNYYWVVACNSAGCSAIDSATPAALSGTPPGTPANQRYEYDGSTIVVSWDASADADTYTVYHDDFFGSSCRLGSRGPSFCEELATDLTAASYTHASPDRDDNYYWVVACNSAGCSAIDSATPAQPSGTPPGTPANQRYEYDGSTIVVSWDASADADTYTVYYDDFFGSSCRLGSRGPSFCEELATDLTAASYTHASPDRDANYYWVVACNSAGCSAIDSANPAALSGTPPGTPANQRYEYDGSTIVVSWDASADADTYTVYHDDFFGSSCRLGSRGPSFCEELATDLTAASYTHTSPDGDANYYWAVACNSAGCSAIDSANPAQPSGSHPEGPAVAPPPDLQTDAVASEGRILARRLSNGRVEFGFQPESGTLVLPNRRFFPANATVGSWLVSTDVVSGEDVLGQITARLLADGRIEFAFNPGEGDRILPRARFFPTTARVDRWLRSSVIDVPVTGPSAATPLSPPVEREALVALYNATDGENWEQGRGWMSDAPLGTWYGVTTNSSGRVTKLDLGENQLNGPIPSELVNLSSLEVLDLSENRLSGNVPAELARLDALVDLYLSDNQLSGAIPDEFGSFSNLRRMLIASNQLNGAIPPELGGLSELTELDLHDNQLTGEIPPDLGRLSNLTELWLSSNQLTGCIPEWLRDLAANDIENLRLPDCGAAPTPDLVVDGPEASESAPEAGARVTLNATVRNQGNGPSASTTLRYYQSTDSTITTGDTEVGTDSVFPLDASGSGAESIVLTAPSSPGAYYYGACVQPDSASGESDTTNNCSAAVTVTVGAAPAPDLAVDTPTLSESAPTAGARFTLSATVRNQGNDSSVHHAALLPVHRLDHHDRRYGGRHGLRVPPRRIGEHSRVDQS